MCEILLAVQSNTRKTIACKRKLLSSVGQRSHAIALNNPGYLNNSESEITRYIQNNIGAYYLKDDLLALDQICDVNRETTCAVHS